MNKRLLLATTAALVVATSAFAQSSPNTGSSTTQRQQDSSPTPRSSASSAPSTNSSSSGSAQTTPSPSPSSSEQNAAGQSNPGTQAPASNNSTSQTQIGQPSTQTSTPSNQAQTPPSNTNTQTQSANPPASGNGNQTQSPGGSASTNTNQQPNNQQNTADRSSNTNVNASVNINDQQRMQISASISRLNVQPLNNVNFSLSVGTAVPRDVRLQPLPAEVVEVVPQYRGYNFVLVKDEIVIVEPFSYQVVAVLPYSGRATAAAPARTEQRKTTFSDSDREVIRKHVRARPVERERRSTGSTVRTEIRTGERLPEGVEVEELPEEVYRDAPRLREYRYIHRDSRTYVIEPHERRVIEEID